LTGGIDDMWPALRGRPCRTDGDMRVFRSNRMGVVGSNHRRSHRNTLPDHDADDMYVHPGGRL